MKIEQYVGGVWISATIGPHEGSDVADGVVRVECELLDTAAEYAVADSDGQSPEQVGEHAIRYTIDNILIARLAQMIAAVRK